MALCAWLKGLDKEVRFFGNAFPVDYARNLAVESFLASPHQKLWFVDDDMVPKDGCEALLGGEEDINVGVCKIWGGTAIGWNHSSHEGRFLGGMGSTVIARKVLADHRMRTENGGVFQTRYGHLGKPVMGEDYDFCFRAQKLGYSVRAWDAKMGHVKAVDLSLL